ncbi:hypothetical protein [Bacteriovorax sp. BSW11_IV]|uniref:hypothetical protein n=1 Tax=Bacteriovorax sp. BSW11_IV TaxID=1353529 RepID=UPI001E3DB93C|nr:hypothetical protein [Bacteriovorax sp. BSW11_IV]
MMTKRDLLNRDRQDAIQIDLSKNDQIKDCHDVRCALDNLFVEGNGVFHAYILSKYGYNTSHYPKDIAKEFSKKDLSVVIRALESQPSFYQKMYANKQLILVDEEKVSIKKGTIANATIEIFSAWQEYDEHMKEYIVFHELAHNMSAKFEIHKNWRWDQFSGWEKEGKRWNLNHPERVISEYGKASQSEEFAESVSSYRYSPQKLKDLDPKKYQFIKNAVFYGVEFLEEKNCDSVTQFKVINETLNNVQLTSEVVATATQNNKCTIEHFRYFFDDKSRINEINECVAKNALMNYFDRNENLAMGLLYENLENYSKYLNFQVPSKPEIYNDRNEIIRDIMIDNTDLFFTRFKEEYLRFSDGGGCYSIFGSLSTTLKPVTSLFYDYEYAGYLESSIKKFCHYNYSLLKEDKDKFYLKYLESRPKH